jgi:kynureninase
LVLLSGVQYFTGQFFEIEKITKKAQSKGCKVGWDCAHAAGNVQLKLHEWNVDFACWCGYKYMNAGAGSISGIFIHEKNFDLIGKSKKLDGWWSHRAETRFMMTNKMEYEYGASSYSISNPSILLCSALKSSLDVNSTKF